MGPKTDRSAEKIHAGTPRKLNGALISAEDAARMLADNPGLAEARAREILDYKPGNRKALLLLGSALRRQGRAEAAKGVLKPLVDDLPQYVTAQSELGLTLAALGQSADAVAAFLHVVDFNRGFSEAWFALGDRLNLLSDMHSGINRPSGEEFSDRNLQLEQSEADLRKKRSPMAAYRHTKNV